MATYKLRLLVNHTTGFVSWLSVNFESYPPIVDPTLDYHTFNGDSKIGLFDAYSNYKLYYSPKTNRFSISDDLLKNLNQFTSAQLLRAKVVASYHACRTVKSKYEQLDLMNTNLYNSLKTVTNEKDLWVGVYQKKYNCSTTEALKLIKFHVDEYETAVFNLESELLMFKHQAKFASSLPDLADNYVIYCNKMITVPFDLKNLPFICGPL